MVDNRAYLQPVHLSASSAVGGCGFERAGKLYLHRTLHGFLSFGKHHLHGLCQWKRAVAEHVGERNHSAATSIVTVAQHSVCGVVSAGCQAQCACAGELLHGQRHDVEAVVCCKIVGRHGGAAQGEKAALCVAQSKVEGGCLQNVSGMPRRKAQAFAAVHDIFAEPYGDLCHSVLWLFVAERIVVQRASYAAESRKIIVAVVFSHYFLYYYSHFFLVYDIARGSHVGFARAIEYGSIYALYGGDKHAQAFFTRCAQWHHVGGIHPGKRLVVRIFEKA